MVNPSLIPTHLVGTCTQAAEADLQALLQAPATTLGHLEEFLEAQARKLMLPILGAAAQALAGRQAFLCPICHRPLLAEAKNRRRTLATVFGSFCLQRDYGWCPRCAEYCAPADQALGLQPQAPASPRLQEIAALLSLRDPYAQAAKDAKQRVDLFRVKEHLYELAKTLYGEGTVQAQQWLKPLLRFLESRKEGALDVLHELQDLRQRLQGLTTSQQEKLEQEIGYFTTHHQRMDYKQAKANGEPVGSGPVESTAGQYQTRFKCTGQFWTLEGDEPLLALATLYRNERWHLLYPHAASTPNGSQNAQTQNPIKSNLALAGKPRQRRDAPEALARLRGHLTWGRFFFNMAGMSELFRGGWIRNGFWMALIIGCAGWTHSARANVYATNVRLNGGITNFTAQPGESVTIDYLLNEPASGGVTINITAGSTVVRAITVPAGASGSLGGPNTVLWDGLDNSSNNVAGGTYSISVTARSVGYTSWTHLTSLDPGDPNTYVFSGRGIAVDRNASSTYFGRVFVANTHNGFSPATTPGDVLGVLKFNADASAPADGIASTGDYNWPDDYDLGPHKLEVSAADQVFVSDLRNGGELLSWDPTFSTNSFVQVLQPGNVPFGTMLSGLAIAGQGTNVGLWMTDSDALSTRGILRWTLGTNGACVPADPGQTVVGFGETNTGLTISPVDVALDNAGNIYACQSVTAPSDPTPRVFRFPAYDPLTNGGVPELTASWAVGAGDDTCGGATGLAVDPTGTYVAVSFLGSASGLPGNTKVFNAATGALVTNIDLDLDIMGITSHQDTDCAWDAAGNLYYIDDYVGHWRAVSPPGANQFTTVATAVVEFTGSSETPPRIIDLSIANGTVTIMFSASASDTPGMFVVKGAPTPGGPFTAIQNADISLVSAGLFKATFAQSGSAQFYTVDRGGSQPQQEPAITNLSVTNGMVTITFYASVGDTPEMFVVKGAATPGGPFAAIQNASISLVSAGLFRATFAASGTIQFYIVDRVGSVQPTTPHITSTVVGGGNVVVTFTGSSSDLPAAFKLLSAPSPAGPFAQVTTAAFEQVSAGVFKATAPTNGPIQFYRIQR